MRNKIRSNTEPAEFTVDGDTAEGREGLHEAMGLYELDAKVWLPFASKTYNISPNIEDYVLTVAPICPADLPNRNTIGFPLDELVKFQPPPVARQTYKAWAGCPMFYEHASEDWTKAYGAVLDSSMHKVSGYGKGKIWKVMGLYATDKVKYPKMAQRLLDKEVTTYSMGADCEYFSCSYCKAPMLPGKMCTHLNPRNDFDWHVHVDEQGKDHLVFRNAHNIRPIELSIVEDPAWTTAKGDTILPAIEKYQRQY